MKWSWAWASAGLAVGSAIAVAACAVGTDAAPDDGQSGTDDDAGSFADTGTTRHDSGTSPGTDSGGGEEDAGTMDDAGLPMTDGGGGMDGGGVGAPCDPPNTCQAGTSIGSVAGDNGGTASGNGDTSKWLTLDVTESDSGPVGVGMSLSVTLSSPAGENFDLFVYLPGSLGQRECTTVTKSSTNGAGQQDTVSLSWGEGIIPNGSDDGRTVTIEVRAAAGNVCQSGANWSVVATGG